MTSAPEFVFSPTAQRQLAHIGGDKRFTRAERQEKIAEILAACRDCAEFPRRWAVGRVEGTRERRVSPFKIVYRPTENGIEVAAIWHERQSREILPPE